MGQLGKENIFFIQDAEQKLNVRKVRSTLLPKKKERSQSNIALRDNTPQHQIMHQT